MVTGFLAVKNAILRGLLHGLKRLHLGARLLGLLFDRLGVSEGTEQGERAGTVGRVVERLPLQQAEAKLRSGVDALLEERAAKRGVRAWLARALSNAALRQVEKVTLARFRTLDAAQGGVDLLVVRDELAATIDGALAQSVAAQLNKVNLLAAGLYVAFAVLLALGLPRLLH